MWIAFAMETLHNPVAAVLGVAGCFAATYGMARGIFTSMYRKRKNELETLTEQLDAMIRDSIAGDQRRAADLPPRLLPE